VTVAEGRPGDVLVAAVVGAAGDGTADGGAE
jgi:hypothetical protein